MIDHEQGFDQQLKASHARAQSDASALNRAARAATSTCGPGVIGGTILPCNTAPDLLLKASEIMTERGKQYDKPDGERSMAQTVKAFNAVTGLELTEPQGWLLMSLLKMVRDQQRTEAHRDSCEDLIAYSALYGESRLKGGPQ